MKSRVLGMAATVSLMLSAGGANAANPITNGGFETPVVPVGSFTNFDVGSAALTGWTVTGPSAGANVSIVSGTFSQNGVSFGNQWLDLTGDGSNTTEGVSQAVSTIPGHEYALTFHIGNTTGGGIFGTTSTVNLFVNGSETPFTNSTVSATDLNWKQFTDTFVATGTSTTLVFQNGDPGNDNSNGWTTSRSATWERSAHQSPSRPRWRCCALASLESDSSDAERYRYITAESGPRYGSRGLRESREERVQPH
jgi:hypothetical protein